MSEVTKNNIMESTLKIDYSGRGVHGIPVIKIIQPVHLVESTNNEAIEDVRDRLIAEFLHTPSMVNRNHFFRLDTYGPLPTGKENIKPIAVTTISAIEEGQMFHTFKHAILDRLISYDNLVEINEFKNSIVINPEQSGNHGPVPSGYDKYLKIQEFFDWLWDQPYAINTPISDRPIEVRRDTVKPIEKHVSGNKSFPMETIRDYFELALEQGERMNAFENTPEQRLDSKVSSAQEAFDKAFDIFGSKQGAEYWQKIIDRIG